MADNHLVGCMNWTQDNCSEMKPQLFSQLITSLSLSFSIFWKYIKSSFPLSKHSCHTNTLVVLHSNNGVIWFLTIYSTDLTFPWLFQQGETIWNQIFYILDSNRNVWSVLQRVNNQSIGCCANGAKCMDWMHAIAICNCNWMHNICHLMDTIQHCNWPLWVKMPN